MKGVSDMDAQNDKKIKGNKNDVKKPIQVLHISKKDTKSEKEEISGENQNISKVMKTEIKAIKPQATEVPINEGNENHSFNVKFEKKIAIKNVNQSVVILVLTVICFT